MIRKSAALAIIVAMVLLTATMPGTALAEEHGESEEILNDINGLIHEINEGILEFNNEIEGVEPVEEIAPLNASNAQEANEEANRLEQEANEKKTLVITRTVEEINYQARQRGYENLELLNASEINTPEEARNETNFIQSLVDSGLVEQSDGEEAIQALNDVANLSETTAALEENASRLQDVDWQAINEYGYEQDEMEDNESMEDDEEPDGDDGDGDTANGDEGLPGFTYIAALIASISVVMAHGMRRR